MSSFLVKVSSKAGMSIKQGVQYWRYAWLADLCGAIFMDDKFERFMNIYVDWYSLDSYDRQEVMMLHWELKMKRHFLPNPEKEQIWRISAAGERLAFNE